MEKGEERDAETVVKLAQSLPERYDATWWRLHIDRGECYVARDADSQQVLGVAVAEQEDACEAHLAALAVDESVRGRGVGSALLRTVQSSLGQGGTFRVHLEVRADDQKAQDFYMRHGYQPEGLLDGVYSDGTSAVRLSRPV